MNKGDTVAFLNKKAYKLLLELGTKIVGTFRFV